MLNEIQKDRLSAVDDFLLQAIRELFDEELEKSKPLASILNLDTLQDNNQLLGEKYRAYLMSGDILAKIFVELSSYRTNNIKSKTFNKGL